MKVRKPLARSWAGVALFAIVAAVLAGLSAVCLVAAARGHEPRDAALAGFIWPAFAVVFFYGAWTVWHGEDSQGGPLLELETKCMRCGYDMRGSPTRVCSECGQMNLHLRPRPGPDINTRIYSMVQVSALSQQAASDGNSVECLVHRPGRDPVPRWLEPHIEEIMAQAANAGVDDPLRRRFALLRVSMTQPMLTAAQIYLLEDGCRAVAGVRLGDQAVDGANPKDFIFLRLIFGGRALLLFEDVARPFACITEYSHDDVLDYVMSGIPSAWAITEFYELDGDPAVFVELRHKIYGERVLAVRRRGAGYGLVELHARQRRDPNALPPSRNTEMDG